MASKCCKVQYDYQSQNPDSELTIQQNEILTILQNDGDWWLCRNNQNQEGYVPKNYVEMITGTAPDQGLNNNFASNTKPVKMVRAQHQYQATREDELGLEPGQLIEVIEESSDGWSKGRSNGQEGWFPANFVVEEPQASAQAASSILTPTKAQDNNTNNPDKNVLFKVRANFPFTSTNQEELNMETDQILHVTDKGDASGWWHARNPQTGQTGLIPSNYVTVIDDMSSNTNKTTSNSQPEDEMVRTQQYYKEVGRRMAEDMLQTKPTGT